MNVPYDSGRPPNANRDITDDEIHGIQEAMPELPRAKVQRFVDELGVTEYDAAVMVQEKSVADYFEEVASVSARWRRSLINSGIRS